MSPIIVAKDLCVGRSHDAVLLRDVTFNVEQGEILAILGPSGAGKSTLLRTLIGLEHPLAGEIWIDGKRHDHLEVEQPSFGVMFQSGALFGSMSVLENVAIPLIEWTHLPNDVVTAISLARLRAVGLEGCENKLPSELSGGMRKRVALARAMALEPPLIFLDEPTAGLDPRSTYEIDALILKINRMVGVTVVMVSHELESIERLAGRCLMLDADSQRIIADGVPSELALASDPRVREFFHEPIGSHR
jgi:phospholipid/cholesterol/gamma-HCH transport system ATP-binding protein